MWRCRRRLGLASVCGDGVDLGRWDGCSRGVGWWWVHTDGCLGSPCRTQRRTHQVGGGVSWATTVSGRGVATVRATCPVPCLLPRVCAVAFMIAADTPFLALFVRCSAASGAVVARSAQPLPGLTSSRDANDEMVRTSVPTGPDAGPEGWHSPHDGWRDGGVQLVEAIRRTGGGQALIIYDLRSKTSAFANRAKGGGYEDSGAYNSVVLKFMGIANIHNIRYDPLHARGGREGSGWSRLPLLPPPAVFGTGPDLVLGRVMGAVTRCNGIRCCIARPTSRIHNGSPNWTCLSGSRT